VAGRGEGGPDGLSAACKSEGRVTPGGRGALEAMRWGAGSWSPSEVDGSWPAKGRPEFFPREAAWGAGRGLQ